MAEGLLRHLAADRFEVVSAGAQPVGLNPFAVEAMREIGVDISSHQSKNVSQFLGRRFSYVITVCDKAKETCPIFPFAFKSLHWSLGDPAAVQGSEEERLEAFRRIRSEIGERLKDFLQGEG
jgi:arsenate reductase